MAPLGNPENRDTVVLLTEIDVTRAHIAAPYVLAAWEARDANYWRRVYLGFLVGAAVPLVGCFALQWSVAVVLAAIVLDVFVQWTCDFLKPVLAYDRVQQEQAHADEAAEVEAVIDALRRRRTPPLLGRDILSAAPKAGFYVHPRSSDPGARASVFVLALIPILFATLVGMLLLGTYFFLPDAFPWLLLGTLIRIGYSMLVTIRAGNDTAWRPELLPEATLPSIAMSALMLPGVLLFEIAEDSVKSIDPNTLGVVALVLYFLIVVVLSGFGLRGVREFVADLRAFIARDREQLKRQVRQVNEGEVGSMS